jgi:primosomal protein N' (replication factor Y)
MKGLMRPIVTLHSGLGNAERDRNWQAARSGQAAIIIGTRSAVFAPMLTPGLIIVDEEHDVSLSQQDGLRYSGP